jgi:hypothetical protein
MKGNNMPGIKERQFYKEDYKTRDYGTLMHEYEKHLQFNEKMKEKKVKNVKWEEERKKLRKWTEADQLFEDELWAS